jgi:protein-disulfide isomerase
MSDQRNFFDMSSKQSLVLGLSWGVAIISVIGFCVMLAGSLSSGSTAVAAKPANANANAAVKPTPTPTPAPEDTGDVSKMSAVSGSDHIRGNKNAKVTLIVVSDYQCPYCQRHETTINQLLKDYGDKIRVVWRNFPLSSIHPYAQKAAEAGECAGEQGKFWEMHDKMFENQSALDEASLKSYAKSLGLNSGSFESCLTSGKMADKVTKQASEAQAAGISGTPGTFVNDQLVKGAYPIDTFKGIIDGLLQ